MRPALIAVWLLACLMLLNASAQAVSGAEQPILRSEELSLEGLLAVEPVGDGFVAVGRSGLIASMTSGDMWVTRSGDQDLMELACGRKLCLAGGGDLLVLIDPAKRSFRSFKPTQGARLIDLSAWGDAFLALYSKRRGWLLAEIGREGVVRGLAGLEEEPIGFLAENLILARGKDGLEILRVTEGLGLERVRTVEGISRPEEAVLREGRVIALERGGIVAEGGDVLLKGSYKSIKLCGGGLIAASGEGAWIFGKDGWRQVPSWLEVEDAACTKLGPILVGDFIGIWGEGGLKLLTPPPGNYRVVEAWRGGALIGGDGILLEYRDGFFKAYSLGDRVRGIAEAGEGAIILGEGGFWTYDGKSIRSVDLEVRAGDFNAVREIGEWIVLAGEGGRILKLKLGSGSVAEYRWIDATDKRINALGKRFAVGDGVAVLLEGPLVAKVKGDLLDVDETACSGIAVGERGVVILRRGSLKELGLGDTATAISIKPDGSYALIGGRKGEVWVYDGYKAVRSLVELGSSVDDLEWISDKEALAIAGGRLYRIVEVERPKPGIALEAPSEVSVYEGSTMRLRVGVKPLWGFEGEVKVVAEGEATPVPAESGAYLRPMCPVNVTLAISPAGEPGSSSHLAVKAYGEGVMESRGLIVHVKPAPKSGGFELPAWSTIVGMIAVLAIIVAVVFIVRRFLGRRAPRMEEVEEL